MTAPQLDKFDLTYSYPWQYGLTLIIRRWDYYPDDGGMVSKWAWAVKYADKYIVEYGYHDVMFDGADGFDSVEDAWADMSTRLLPAESYKAALDVYGENAAMVAAPSPDDLVSVAEAAKMLGVTPSRIRALISNDQLVAHKPHGRWMIERRSVQDRMPTTLDVINRWAETAKEPK